MGAITTTKGGRKPVMDYVDGELMFIKRISKVGTSHCIFLPSEWFALCEMRCGKRPTKIGMSINDKVIIIKPYFGEGLEK